MCFLFCKIAPRRRARNTVQQTRHAKCLTQPSGPRASLGPPSSGRVAAPPPGAERARIYCQPSTEALLYYYSSRIIFSVFKFVSFDVLLGLGSEGTCLRLSACLLSTIHLQLHCCSNNTHNHVLSYFCCSFVSWFVKF